MNDGKLTNLKQYNGNINSKQKCYRTCKHNKINQLKCAYKDSMINRNEQVTNNRFEEKQLKAAETCMMATNTYDETMMEDGMNIWVADTAATCHMGCILIGMKEKRPSNTSIRVGNGESIHGNAICDINVTYIG